MKQVRHRALIFTSFVALIGCNANAQDYFREFGSSRSSGGIGRLSPAAEVYSGNNPDGLSPISPVDENTDSDDTYNFRLGNVDFVVAAGLGLEFNDNINLSETDRLADLILRPELDIEGIWRTSESSRLRFGVGLSYAKYVSNPEFDSDSVLISPTSALAWTLRTGAFTITLRERLSYQEDPFDQPQISGIANYGRWENQAGIQVDWEANDRTKITFGYDRYDLWATDAAFQSQDRGTNTIYVRPSYQISPYVTVGLNTSVSSVNFQENVQADALVYLIGPYVMWKYSDYTDLYLEAGYQRSDFDGATTVSAFDADTGQFVDLGETDEQNGSSVYAKFEWRNRPTENFRQKVVASKTTEIGFGTNYYDLYHIEYTADWKLAERTSLTPTLFYEYYETSGEPKETGNRLGAAVGLHHILSEHLTVGLDYRFLLKDTNVPDSNYYQNLALLSFYYKF